MKIEEVMVGDWVHYKCDLGKDGIFEKDCKIENIYGSEFNCEVRDYEIISGKRISNCEPIPISGEILEKNGFKLQEGCTSAWQWGEGEVGVYISGGPECPIGQTLTVYVSGTAGAGYSSHRVIYEMKIRGIHELQHALKLCGIKKEIVL